MTSCRILLKVLGIKCLGNSSKLFQFGRESSAIHLFSKILGEKALPFPLKELQEPSAESFLSSEVICCAVARSAGPLGYTLPRKEDCSGPLRHVVKASVLGLTGPPAAQV